MNQKYSPEMRERTLRMLDETKASGEHRNLMTAIRHVAGLLDMSPETLRVRTSPHPRRTGCGSRT